MTRRSTWSPSDPFRCNSNFIGSCSPEQVRGLQTRISEPQKKGPSLLISNRDMSLLIKEARAWISRTPAHSFSFSSSPSTTSLTLRLIFLMQCAISGSPGKSFTFAPPTYPLIVALILIKNPYDTFPRKGCSTVLSSWCEPFRTEQNGRTKPTKVAKYTQSPSPGTAITTNLKVYEQVQIQKANF